MTSIYQIRQVLRKSLPFIWSCERNLHKLHSDINTVKPKPAQHTHTHTHTSSFAVITRTSGATEVTQVARDWRTTRRLKQQFRYTLQSVGRLKLSVYLKKEIKSDQNGHWRRLKSAGSDVSWTIFYGGGGRKTKVPETQETGNFLKLLAAYRILFPPHVSGW